MQTSSSCNSVAIIQDDEPSAEETGVVNDQVVSTPFQNDDEMLPHADSIGSSVGILIFTPPPPNLSKDVYLQMLQQLNDGHVPISILANFTKIQTICPLENQQARSCF
jgi:hypothetical protein